MPTLQQMELGVYTFVERTPDPGSGELVSADERLRNLIEEAEVADQAGLDVFGVGEHHRPEYVASAPAVILAAIAARTRRIRLTSAVSVLSSDDPVRLFQQFATLDLLSGGRAELMAGRGSFIESFPLFGYDLDDYSDLFAEKLDLLLAIRKQEAVTWKGRHRPALHAQRVYPRPLQDPLPVWVAVGGTPASAARAGRLGLPLALAILGGRPEQFAPLVALYRDSGQRAGHDAARLQVGVNLHAFVAEDTRKAVDLAYPAFLEVMNTIGRERGWGRIGREHFDAMREDGVLLIGGPEEVAEAIVRHHGIFRHQRTLLQLTVGTLPQRDVLRAIELLGTRVAPLVRSEVEGGTL